MLSMYVSKHLCVKSEVGLVDLDARVHQVCPHDSPRRGCVGAPVDGPRLKNSPPGCRMDSWRNRAYILAATTKSMSPRLSKKKTAPPP